MIDIWITFCIIELEEYKDKIFEPDCTNDYTNYDGFQCCHKKIWMKTNL